MFEWPHTCEVGADCTHARGGERLEQVSDVERWAWWKQKLAGGGAKRKEETRWSGHGAVQGRTKETPSRERQRESEVFFWVWTARKLAASGPRHPYFGLGGVTVGSTEGVGVPCPSHATIVYQICIFKAHHYYFYVYKLFLTIGSRK
jgi:hypothetical protein